MANKRKWQVNEIVVERQEEAPEIDVGAYARMVARILDRPSRERRDRTA